MGEFEDLIAKAKDGDASALDDLEEKFSGSALRQKAEEADKLRADAEANTAYARRGRFVELAEQLSSELSDSGLTLEDLGDVAPGDITLDLLKSKAQEKQTRSQEMQLTVAKQAGFETVAAYETALETGKQQMAQQQQGMEAVGGAVASGSGGNPPPPGETDPYKVMTETHEAARKSGRTQDLAMGDAVEALMAAQAPAPEE